jgi:hypothetical protein
MPLKLAAVTPTAATAAVNAVLVFMRKFFSSLTGLFLCDKRK